MNKNPLVSVVVPVYNVEKYLAKCVDSVIQQTLKEIEIILVDDGSTDSSGKICDDYAKKDKRIIVIHQKNARLAAARNKGIQNAHGEYISFVDSDDYIHQDFLKSLYQSAIKYNADIAVAHVRTIPETPENNVNYYSFYHQKQILIQPSEKIGILYSCAVWNKLYKFAFLKENNIHFETDLFLEDVTFTQISSILANKIILVKDAFYFYNIQNPQSFMRMAENDSRTISMLDMTERTKKFLSPVILKKYLPILNTFEIRNLYSWFLSSSKTIKKDFYIGMKQIIEKMNTPILTDESRKIYSFIKNSKNADDLLAPEITLRIFKIIKLHLRKEAVNITLFHIPVFYTKENKFYFLSLCIGKVKVKPKIVLNTFKKGK